MTNHRPGGVTDNYDPPPLKHDLRRDLVQSDTESGFETIEMMCEENTLRATALMASNLAGAGRLAAILSDCEPGNEANTLASGLRWRLDRLYTADKLINAVEQEKAKGVTSHAFHIVMPQHIIRADKLHESNPIAMNRWLRRLVQRHLPQHATGWLFCQLDGEFEATSNTYILHFHGLVGGDYHGVLNGPVRAELTRQGSRHVRPNGIPKVRVPLRINALRDVPRQVSYALQSWWPARPVVITERGEKRVRDKHRIPEPYHSQYLLWLHQFTFSDIRLRMGMGNTW